MRMRFNILTVQYSTEQLLLRKLVRILSIFAECQIETSECSEIFITQELWSMYSINHETVRPCAFNHCEATSTKNAKRQHIMECTHVYCVSIFDWWQEME